MGDSGRQDLVQLINYIVHLVAEERVPLSRAALAIERSHVQVVAVQMERGDDVLTDHARRSA